MTPGEMLPDYLFDESGLALAYCYTLHLLHSSQTRVRFEGATLSLRPQEVLVPIRRWDERIGMPPEAFLGHLATLEDLDLVRVTREERYVLVQFTRIHVSVPADVAIHESDDGPAFSITVNDFADRYMEYYAKNRSPRASENVQRVMKHFTRHFGRHQLEHLLGVHLNQYIDIRKKEGGVGDTTLNMDIRAIKAAFSMAVTWNHLKTNPFESVQPIRQDARPKPFLRREEFASLLKAVQSRQLVPMFAFGVLSGFRRGEILYLRWKDIDLERAVITVQSSEEYRVKHGKARVFPLTQELRALLQAMVYNGEFVFSQADGTPYSKDFPTREFKKAVRLAGLDESLTFHSLRVTFATWMREAGVQTHIIQSLLGHAHLRTTEGYTQTPPESVVKAVEGVRLLAA